MNWGLFGLVGIPSGLDALSEVSRSALRAADNLEPDLPEVSDFVREAAHVVERLSIDLRERSLSDIASSVSSFAQDDPIGFLGGAMLAGFVLARLSRRGSQELVAAAAPDRASTPSR